MIDRAAVVLRLTSGTMILALMALTVVDVVGRQVFARGVDQTIEVTEVALVIVAFLGLAGATVSGTHAKTTILTSQLKRRTAAVLRIVGGFVTVVFLAWAAWQCGHLAVESIRSGEHRFGLARVPLWPARAAIAFGISAMALLTLLRTLAELADFRAGRYQASEEPVDVLL